MKRSSSSTFSSSSSTSSIKKTFRPSTAGSWGEDPWFVAHVPSSGTSSKSKGFKSKVGGGGKSSSASGSQSVDNSCGDGASSLGSIYFEVPKASLLTLWDVAEKERVLEKKIVDEMKHTMEEAIKVVKKQRDGCKVALDVSRRQSAEKDAELHELRKRVALLEAKAHDEAKGESQQSSEDKLAQFKQQVASIVDEMASDTSTSNPALFFPHLLRLFNVLHPLQAASSSSSSSNA